MPGARAVHPINGKLRDELLDAEVFHTLADAKVRIEQWRRHYNTKRPHFSLGYRLPEPEVLLPMPPWPSAPTGSSQGAMLAAH